MAFLASVVALRIALYALINSLITEDSVTADASLLAIWFTLFAFADCAAMYLLSFKPMSFPVLIMLYVSSVWNVALAAEQIFLADYLLGYDQVIQLMTTIALVGAAVWEGWRCRKPRPQFWFSGS